MYAIIFGETPMMNAHSSKFSFFFFLNGIVWLTSAAGRLIERRWLHTLQCNKKRIILNLPHFVTWEKFNMFSFEHLRETEKSTTK